MLGLEYFSFADVWSPVLLVVAMAIGVLYTFVVGPWRGRFRGSAEVPIKRQIVFLAAIALLYLTQGGPLSMLGHMMFTFHMTSMVISYVIVPPMLLYGIPAWLWRWTFDRRWLRPLRFVMNPLVTLFLFNMLFSFYHMPDIHDWVMTHYTEHAIYYFLLLVTAVMNWWHVNCPVPEWQRLSPLLSILYVFMNGLLLTPACVFIIFAGTPLFSVYNDPDVWVKAMGYCISGDPAAALAQFDGPAFFNLMSPEDDQQLGGIVMKLLQEVANVIALLVVFMRWYRKERAKEDETPDGGGPVIGRLNNV